MPHTDGKLKTLLKDAVAYGLTLALSKFVIILLIPLYTRFLTVGKYGALDTLLLIGTFLTILFLCGQEEALGRFYYDTEARDKKSLLGAVFANILLISLFLSVLLTIFAEPIAKLIFKSGEYTYEFRLIIIYSFSTALLTFFRSLARWEFNKKRYFFLTIAPTLTILIATFIAVAIFDLGIRGAIYSQIIANTAFTIISLFLFRFSLPLKRFFVPLLKYGAPVMIVVSLASALNVVDKSFYIHLFGEETLGLYSIGWRYAIFIALPQAAFWVAWGPLIFSTYKDKDVHQTANNALLLFSTLFAFALILQFSFAEVVIKIISSDVYLEGIKFALPFSFLLVLEGSGSISSIGIDIEKKTYLTAFITIAGIIAAIALIFPLTKFFNAVGLAYALLLSKVFTMIARVAVSERVSSIRLKLIVPYGVLTLSFILSFISINLNASAAAIALYRTAAVLVMAGLLCGVLLKLFFIPNTLKR
jgi:O-antigen/teichoic acid export membrane protein